MIKLVHHEMVINSKFLEVPRSYYQRNLNANRVKRIAAEFDERIANAPKVSYRDGHYYVFDGQHTAGAGPWASGPEKPGRAGAGCR